MLQCINCDKCFSHKFSLRRHSRTCGNVEPPPRIVCSSCGRTFSRNDTFRTHWKSQHEGIKMTKNIICDSCNKAFFHKKQFKTHWKKYHEHSQEENVAFRTSRNVPLKCAVCHVEIAALAIMDHYVNEHKIDGLSDYEYHDFDSEDSFQEWKKSVEESTACRYIKAYSAAGRAKLKYVCHRSGEFKTKGKGIRCIKTQGSKKINGFCPAHIQKLSVGQKIQARFLKTHVGHENELCHVHISPAEKMEIVSRLEQKVPKSDILKDIRESYTGGDIDRIHLLTIKDIANIRKQYKLKECKSIQNESITLTELVEENKSNVLYYKARDTDDAAHPFLDQTNFVLILMNDAQAEVLKEFGNNIIAVDGIRDTEHGFALHTIIILDEMRQGIPVASMISDREDSSVLHLFFSKIKSKIGVKIEPQVLMSNMVDELYYSWKQVMGHPNRRIFCTWDVIDAWKNKLNEAVKDKDKISHTCRALRALLEETKEHEFYVRLKKVIEDFNRDDELKIFSEYFNEHYVPKMEFWAYCFRTFSEININMSLERVHQTIKYYYTKNDFEDRLDKFLLNFLQFSRDRLFNRIITNSKGKFSYKFRELRKRHNSSLTDEVQITVVEDNFIVSSEDKVYYVTKNVDSCGCKFVCHSCKACIHQFICTCVDSCIKWNMCKHIHSVCQYIINEQSKDAVAEFIISPDGNVICSSSPIVSEVPSRSASPNVEQLTSDDGTKENSTIPKNDDLCELHMEIVEIVRTTDGKPKIRVVASDGSSTSLNVDDVNIKTKRSRRRLTETTVDYNVEG